MSDWTPSGPALRPTGTAISEPRPSSRIPGFYRLTPAGRVRALIEAGWLAEEDGAFLLASGAAGLPLPTADHMVENAVGVLGLPIGLGLNFLVNGRDYIVPMAVEEASVVAAASGAAKLVREAGGFEATSTAPLMLGQIQVAGCPDPAGARDRLLAHKRELLKRADALCANMVRRGGGARDLDVRILGPVGGTGNGDRTMVVLHLTIDTRDAMGANTINAVVEGLADRVGEIAGGGVHLRILSNLPDRCRARARCSIPSALLGTDSFPGEEVARRIALASLFAEEDPYRAATHNKGIMNGIDAVALATGNDWRAIEAGAHAYAVRDGRYTALARWHVADSGDLVGELELPMAVGTVGGAASTLPAVAVLRRLLNVEDAKELREVTVSVGLAQNLAALRALATEGIQRGHMTLHARSVAVAAGAAPDQVAEVARRLVEGGEVKARRARQILRDLRREGDPETA